MYVFKTIIGKNTLLITFVTVSKSKGSERRYDPMGPFRADNQKKKKKKGSYFALSGSNGVSDVHFYFDWPIASYGPIK
jgi:hypothetical protein